ncbi:MAG: HlyD family secretion protein [Bacteroidia bacterium]
MAKKEKQKNKIISRIVLIGLLIIGLLIGIAKYREAQHYETTDDAQLGTDISPVSARVSGYMTKVFFTDNQSVKKGDTLVMLDDRDLKIKVEQAEIALENVKAMLDVTKTNANTLYEGGGISVFKIDELTTRLNKAEKDFERYKNLFQAGATTQQQLEKMQLEKETLAQRLQAMQQQQKETNSQTNAANEQIKVAESVVKQRQAELDFAKLQLSYAVITVPFDGIVSKKNAVVGQLIQTGQPLCSIVVEQNLWIVANFKETQITKMKIGMKVEVEVDAFSEKKITGKVASFSSATGSQFSLIPPDNATGNYVKVVQRIPVKIELDKTNDALKDLKAGMSVNVKVILAE